MRHTRIKVIAYAFALAVLIGAAAACSDDGGGDGVTATPAAPTVAAPTPVPGTDERVTLTGELTLDGAPLNTDFLGARVVHDDGLAAACQSAIPNVFGGAYDIPVASDAEVRGCGGPGSEIMLWAYVGD